MKAQTGVTFENFKSVDSVVHNFLNAWNISGAEVAITKDGKLIYNKGFGFSDRRYSSPATPHNLYRVASVSKPITSIAIMKLVEEGRLNPEDLVFGPDKILDQPYYLQAISDYRIYSITVRDLLEHTSGWDRKVPSGQYGHSDPAFFPLHVTTTEDAPNPVGDSTLIRYSLRNGLNHEPGTTYAYSNIGYLVLGKIIERISGMTYEDYVTTHIFHPLSIYDIHMGKNLPEDKQEREADYISQATTLSCYGNGSRVPCQYGGFNLEAMNAHGGWIASAADLTKLILAVDGFETSPDLLSPASIRMMTQPGSVNTNYAKGWSVNSRNNWWHTGSLDGSASFIGRTSDGYTWAILFNSRADNSNAFWSAFDKLPWNCIKKLKDYPDVNLFAPGVNASRLSSNVLTPGSVYLNWKNGDGDGRIVLVSEDPAFNGFPVDGSAYTANAAFGKGSDLGNSVFVAYKGTADSTRLTQLNPAKTYFIRVYEYYKNEKTGYQEIYKLGNGAKKAIQPTLVFPSS